MGKAPGKQGRRNRHRAPDWLVILVVLALARVAGAQSEITLAPGFEPDPQALTGTAGGPVDASTYERGPLGSCVGWIANSPNHVLNLTEPVDFLMLAVTSAGDTTLVVQGPVGNWCNDDSEGLNPALFGRWAAGSYRIYVGTYNPGQWLPYTITMTAESPSTSGPPPSAPPTFPPVVTPVPPTPPPYVPPTPPPPVRPPTPPPVPPSGTAVPPVRPAVPVAPPTLLYGLDISSVTPNFGSMTLAPGFVPDPQVLNGTSGGTVQASSAGVSPTGPCRGWVSANPDHLVTLTTRFTYLLIDVSSSGDTTLVINGPGGFRCSDDAVGLNPRVGGLWTPGTYRIWVGSYDSGQFHPYTILFSERYP